MMTLDRRSLLIAAATFSFASSLATAADVADTDWPNRPVKIVCSYVTGGSSDIVARILAQYLAQKFGKSFVVDNRPGAGGAVSAGLVKTAAPDGYTLMMSTLGPFSLAPTQFPTLSYDAVKDFTHISFVGVENTALFASPSLGVSSLAEFIALAKAQPTRISYGSSGVGSAAHINGEYLKSLAGIQMLHVPYKGAAPMIQDFYAGTINSYISSLILNMPSVEAGKARVIASLARGRAPGAMEVKTFREQGYDIVSENWFGFSAPAGLSPAIVAKLDHAVREVVVLPAVQEQFHKLGVTTVPMAPGEFSRFVSQQIEAWRPRIIAAGAIEK
jgi:tripartite-type tricarboxylate transporter receptor subunit TctC